MIFGRGRGGESEQENTITSTIGRTERELRSGRDNQAPMVSEYGPGFAECRTNEIVVYVVPTN